MHNYFPTCLGSFQFFQILLNSTWFYLCIILKKWRPCLPLNLFTNSHEQFDVFYVYLPAFTPYNPYTSPQPLHHATHPVHDSFAPVGNIKQQGMSLYQKSSPPQAPLVFFDMPLLSVWDPRVSRVLRSFEKVPNYLWYLAVGLMSRAGGASLLSLERH